MFSLCITSTFWWWLLGSLTTLNSNTEVSLCRQKSENGLKAHNSLLTEITYSKPCYWAWSWTSSILTTNLPKTHFNIILLLPYLCSKSKRVPHQTLYVFLVSIIRATCPVHRNFTALYYQLELYSLPPCPPPHRL